MALTGLEYRMLAELSVNAGRMLTNHQLLQRVWGPDKTGGSGPVRDIIERLRRKLGDDANNPTYILNEPRGGFSMAKGGRRWRKLEEFSLPLPMDKNAYGMLSRQFVHVNPKTSPQSHNPFSLPTLGGYFQEGGALPALNLLGGMVGWMLWLAVTLIEPPLIEKSLLTLAWLCCVLSAESI